MTKRIVSEEIRYEISLKAHSPLYELNATIGGHKKVLEETQDPVGEKQEGKLAIEGSEDVNHSSLSARPSIRMDSMNKTESPRIESSHQSPNSHSYATESSYSTFEVKKKDKKDNYIKHKPKRIPADDDDDMWCWGLALALVVIGVLSTIIFRSYYA